MDIWFWVEVGWVCRHSVAMAIGELVAHRRLRRPEMRRALRLEAGLTLDDIAEKVGVTRSAVSRWERGLREPQGRNRIAYVSLLAELEEVVANV